jgi:MFS family permease
MISSFKNIIKSYYVWIVAVVCLLFQFVLQFSSGIMASQLMETFNLTAARAGFLAGSYYHIYVLLQTPAGFLTDRYGPKNLMSYGCIICCLGCFVFSHANFFYTAEIGRIMMGGGLSFAFVGMVYVTATVLPPSIFSLMIGVAETLAMAGTLISELYLSKYIDIVGWRYFVSACGIIALVLSVIAWVSLPGGNSNVEDDDIAREVLSFKDVFRQLLELVSNPVAWANGIYAGLMFAVLTTFHGLWAQPFFIEVYHFSVSQSANYCSLMVLGALIGFPFAGWLGGRVKETKYFMAITALCNAIFLLMVLTFITMPHYILVILLLLIGFVTGAYVLSYSIAHNIVSAGAKSTSIGFTNTLAVITAPLMQPLVGLILDLVTTTSKYSTLDFQLALGILPLCLIISAVLACFLPTANKNIKV